LINTAIEKQCKTAVSSRLIALACMVGVWLFLELTLARKNNCWVIPTSQCLLDLITFGEKSIFKNAFYQKKYYFDFQKKILIKLRHQRNTSNNYSPLLDA
jgi:hypothetical protein